MLKYRILRGSTVSKTNNGFVQIPSIRVVVDDVRGNKQKRIGVASVLIGFAGKNLFRELYVNPKYQGKGVGRELLKRLFRKVNKDNLYPLYTRANPYENKAMTRNQLMKFYTSFGFVKINKKGIRFGTDDNGQPMYRVGTGPGAMILKRENYVNSQ